MAVQLEQQLEAAGFIVDQDVREYQHIEADALAGKFDAFILSRATVLDSGDPVAYLYSDFACNGSFNIAQFCDAAVDAALVKAAAIPAGPDRRSAIAAAEALILPGTLPCRCCTNASSRANQPASGTWSGIRASVR